MTARILTYPKTCSIEGCEKPIKFKADGICQMHYFRKMRTGHFGTSLCAPGERRMNHSGGYIMLRLPGHPLAQKHGNVFEHRKVMYDIHGENLPPCELCGAESRWSSRTTHIDHIDRDKSNNDPSNLRVLCNPCNVGRDRKPPSQWRGAMAIELNGVVKTPAEWARESDVGFCGASIARRIRLGMGPSDAIYGEKKTHNGKKAKPPKRDPIIRKDAVLVTIDDKTMTAAEWSRSELCSVDRGTIVYRIRAGWDREQAVKTPPSTGPNKRNHSPSAKPNGDN